MDVSRAPMFNTDALPLMLLEKTREDENAYGCECFQLVCVHAYGKLKIWPLCNKHLQTTEHRSPLLVRKECEIRLL